MEDLKIEIKTQALQLCKMLSKPDNERMPFEGVQIAKTLQKISLFSKFFDMKSEQFINLCITSHIFQFQQGCDIYEEQNNQSRYIYIILEGQVKVILSNQNQNSIFQPQSHILSEFGTFGQTEIFFKIPRRCEQITSLTEVKCMVLEQNKILELINSYSFLQKALHYFTVNEYFEKMSLFQRQQLVLYCNISSFSKGNKILSENQKLTSIIFFVNGRVSVVRTIQFKSQTSKFVIDQLEQMDSFGQYECVTGRLSQVQLFAKTSGSLYLIDYQRLKNSNHKVLQLINQKAIPYPQTQQLQFLYNVKTELKKQQNKIAKKNGILV